MPKTNSVVADTIVRFFAQYKKTAFLSTVL